MTSSLVGSEMCIRDSHRCEVFTPPVVWRSVAPRMAVQSLPLVTSCAVSYTHLTLPTICSV
eukprot:11022441-Prorocentrum_lima.AAC.1